MMQARSSMPPGLIGFEVAGKRDAEDSRDVLIPVLERAAGAGDVRFLLRIPEFSGMSGGAVREDLTVGFDHLRAWKRIALVTDIEWMTHLTALFGCMPGGLKTFALSEQAAAATWVAG